jgi:hypothetical protein
MVVVVVVGAGVVVSVVVVASEVPMVGIGSEVGSVPPHAVKEARRAATVSTRFMPEVRGQLTERYFDRVFFIRLVTECSLTSDAFRVCVDVHARAAQEADQCDALLVGQLGRQ